VIAYGVVGERTGGPEPDVRAVFHLAGTHLEVESDDLELIDELAALLGPPVPAPPGAESQMAASVHTRVAPGAFGRIRLRMPRPDQLAPTDLVLATSSPDFPFDLLESSASRVVLAQRGGREPALVVDGAECRIALAPGWRKAVGLLLLHRLMRCREDAIFFHAGSVVLGGGGMMLVGAKGAGKSTLALGLAARGHGLLGDEHACYFPATGELAPFRRPVGVKPGPRTAPVEALLRRLGRSPERDGMMRVAVDELLPGPDPRPAPLRAVVFLTGFAPRARLRAIAPSREDVGRLQPVASSLLNAPRTRRVFEMSRLLQGARVYELEAGGPDETAELLEEALSA
jgi:hypothetical protein